MPAENVWEPCSGCENGDDVVDNDECEDAHGETDESPRETILAGLLISRQSSHGDLVAGLDDFNESESGGGAEHHLHEVADVQRNAFKLEFPFHKIALRPQGVDRCRNQRRFCRCAVLRPCEERCCNSQPDDQCTRYCFHRQLSCGRSCPIGDSARRFSVDCIEESWCNLYSMPQMIFSWDTADRPIVALAPMAGVTDASYRQLIKKIAPEVVVYTEFLSTDAIHYGARKTMEMINFDPALERPYIVQVFGKDPDHFLSAAKVIEELGADGIDINMGCPAAKVVSSCHGSALIRDPDLAAELVHATKKAVKIPVSVKTRLGWDKIETLLPFCQRIVEAGAEALAIHGRRYCDKFSGAANWDPIYELKKALPHIPIIGNRDITCAADAVAQIKNLDGVMVGRGTFGNPWVMGEVCEALRNA